MNAVLHPVGPESPRTYWVRRGIALAALIAVILLAYFAFRPDRDTPVAPPPASPETTTTTPGPSVSGPPAVSPGTQMTLPSTCDPKALTLALAGPDSISATAPVDFTLTIAQSVGTSCVLDLDAHKFELRVFSGSDRIWSTADCSTLALTGMREIGTEPATFAFTWPVRRSSPDCQLSDVLLRPGTYVATAELTGAAPVQKVMVLS